MAYRIVGKDDWVVFPINQSRTVQLEWSDRKQVETTQTADYYMDKCWFAQPKDNDGVNNVNFYKDGLNFGKGGHTLIFIAAECIEERTAKSPVPKLRENHIRDRMAAVKNTPQGQAYVDVPTTWAVLKVNEQFHYGQDNDKTMRWLVYHAGIEKRRMYQHRFGKDVAVAAAKAGIDIVAEGVKTGTKVAAPYGAPEVSGSVVRMALSALLNFVCRNAGHELKPFGPDGTPLKKNEIEEAEKAAAIATIPTGLVVNVEKMKKTRKVTPADVKTILHVEKALEASEQGATVTVVELNQAGGNEQLLPGETGESLADQANQPRTFLAREVLKARKARRNQVANFSGRT